MESGTFMRRALSAALLMVWANAALAQSPQQFADLGDFQLENGQTIKSCRIGYRTYGALNADRSNVVLFPTWFGGKSADLEDFIGQGRLLDTGGLYVITVDALGNGVSSSPSNSKVQPGEKFPAFSIRDMVRSQHILLTKVLKIDHLRAVVGISMGGMQAFEWMVSYPTFLDRGVSIVGTPKQTARDLLVWKSQLRIIQEHRADTEDARRGMLAVARLHLLALQTPSHHLRSKPEDADKLLDAQESEIARKNPNDWASQLVAMIGHDIYKPFESSEEKVEKAIRAKALVIVVSTDQLVNPAPSIRFAERTKSRSLVLTNDGGHLGAGMEMDRVITAVRDFLYARD